MAKSTHLPCGTSVEHRDAFLPWCPTCVTLFFPEPPSRLRSFIARLRIPVPRRLV